MALDATLRYINDKKLARTNSFKEVGSPGYATSSHILKRPITSTCSLLTNISVISIILLFLYFVNIILQYFLWVICFVRIKIL